MDFSINLKNFFEQKKSENITATSIADKLNISKKTLSNYINGDAYIPLEHLNNLCNIFDVSLDYIFGLNKKEQYPNSINITKLNAAEIGARIKTFRKEHKISQQKLANILGLNKSCISRYESGQNLILSLPLYILCKEYNVSADYLLGKINEPQS